jgi:hypothetical protein
VTVNRHQHGVDYVGLSFVRTAEDVRTAIREIAELGGRAPVIAKIETRAALDHQELLRAGRGDSRLGRWWRWEESNLRHGAYETPALPLSYTAAPRGISDFRDGILSQPGRRCPRLCSAEPWRPREFHVGQAVVSDEEPAARRVGI